MDADRSQIFDRIRQAGPGRVFTPKDFLDTANRDAADQALSRLARRGAIKRLARGLYYTPKRNARLGIDVPPDLDEIAAALGRQTGSRIVPSGAVAANQLGLSTQVPAKPVYLTDGRSRTVRVGQYIVQLKHALPKDLPAGTDKTALVIQALRFLGKDAITDQVIQTIQTVLTMDERKQLLDDAKYATDWLCQAVRRISLSREQPTDG
ncbi:MAG: type IV toxin-antitoxin system AbiEi family antitoxin domain-containing protein [Phycisphaerales bacterium]|nr:type IV toxin-antitoxin system AbiEi family antitoxin domain-containing protein [Phycisphaerales bacterium]